jgi:ribosomal protein S17E
VTKKGEFEKNKQALDEYTEKWTKSKNLYDVSRTSIGHAPR